MSALLNTYNDNGYNVFEANGKHFIYKFTSSGDRSLVGCLYVRTGQLTPEDTMTDEEIYLIDMTDIKYSCLQNDNAVASYITQTTVK